MKALQCGWLAGACLVALAPAWAGNYNLGEGVTAGPVNIAGYLNLVAEAPRGDVRQLIVDDLSLFVGGRFNRYLNPFFEAEFSGASLWREGRRPLADNHPNFVVERLYNDTALTSDLTLRVGKMLTPVGEWNNIHAAPLVATTTRPLTTKRGFPEYATGLALQYAGAEDGWPEAQLYWQPAGEFRRRQSERSFHEVAGLHLTWASGLTDKLGLSLQRARVRGSDDVQLLAGLNARRTYGRVQFETEAVYIHIQGANPVRLHARERGAYVMGSYALDERWSVLARYERYDDRNAAQGSRNALVGLTWRQDPAVLWKLEYVKQSGAVLGIRTGVQASLAVLF